MAGVVGVDPYQHSLRDLLIMFRAKAEFDWGQTANLLCLLANIHRDPKRQKQPFEAKQFNPYHREQPRRKRTPDLRINLTDLKDMLCKPAADSTRK